MKLFYLQNVRSGLLGNSPYWWRKGASGYTPFIDEAEQFTKEAANEIIKSTRGTHKFKKWPVAYIDSKAKRLVDVQDLDL